MTETILDSINTETDMVQFMASQLLCSACSIDLCPREKVINLAMGQVEKMLCLACLGKRDSIMPQHLLAKIRKYIHSRQCFEKEWLKYKDNCPHGDNCLPHKAED